jgi:hypothetical protein
VLKQWEVEEEECEQVVMFLAIVMQVQEEQLVYL